MKTKYPEVPKGFVSQAEMNDVLVSIVHTIRATPPRWNNNTLKASYHQKPQHLWNCRNSPTGILFSSYPCSASCKTSYSGSVKWQFPIPYDDTFVACTYTCSMHSYGIGPAYLLEANRNALADPLESIMNTYTASTFSFRTRNKVAHIQVGRRGHNRSFGFKVPATPYCRY